MARRRRRRPDGSENLDELEEDEDLDIRVTSVEEEIQNLAVSTLSQTQQLTALRAKLDKVARELEEGHDGDDELFQELDGLKTSVNSLQAQVHENQANNANRLAQLQMRLDQIGSLGTVEEALAALQQAIEALHDKVEDRARAAQQTREEDNEQILARLEEFNLHLDDARVGLQSRLQEVAQQFEELKRSSVSNESMGRLTKDLESRFDTLASEVERNLSEIEGGLHTSIEAQAKEQVQIRQNVTAAIDELASLLDERASQEDLSRIKQQLADLTSKLEVTGGVEERARGAVAEVQKLESLVREQGERIKTLVEQGQRSLSEVEKHQDKVNIAIKLVDALTDRGRGGAAPLDAGRPLGGTVSDHELDAPDKTELGFELKDLVGVMVTHQATDLHLKVDSAPTVRLRGELIPVGNHILGEEDCRRLIFSTLTRPQRRTLLENKHVEILCEIQGARMRALCFVQRGRLSASFKVVQRTLSSMEELGLPLALKKLVSTIQSGLLLVGGPAGSGKSTTLAALVELLNQTRKIHIVTLEKPVEYIHADQQALVTQREVGADAAGFAAGLREAMRMDPDVIMLEKLEDPETLCLALGAADSGHLVLAGIDCLTAGQSLDYLSTLVRASQTSSLSQIASCLRGVICQKLLPRADRKGLVVSTEMLVNNAAVAQCIVEGSHDRIQAMLRAGQAEGGHSFAHSLQKLLDASLISDSTMFGEGPTSSAPSSAPASPAAAPRPGKPAPAPPPPDLTPPAGAAGDETIMGWL